MFSKHRIINATCFIFHVFSIHSSGNNGLSILSPAKQFKMSGWLSKQMFFGIRYGIHVPVWATPSLFNTSCNSQEIDTTAARTPPQLSDLAVVLSRPIAHYIFLKLRWKQCMKCMQSVYVELKQACRKPKQRSSSRLPVTPQSSKINLLASWLFAWPYNPNSWLQWESALHTVISKLYGAQGATAQYLRSPLVKYSVFELLESKPSSSEKWQHLST